MDSFRPGQIPQLSVPINHSGQMLYPVEHLEVDQSYIGYVNPSFSTHDSTDSRSLSLIDFNLDQLERISDMSDKWNDEDGLGWDEPIILGRDSGLHSLAVRPHIFLRIL